MSAKYVMVLDLDRCIGCFTCVVACKMTYGTKPGINYNGVEIIEWGNYPNAHQRYKLTMCMHCDDPSCVKVCPTNATFKNENGIVQIDYDKCIGCGYCKVACPYDQRHIVRDDDTSYEGIVAPYEEQSYGRVNVAEKCTFCAERVATGVAPMCTIHCPSQCRIFGDVNDPDSTVSKYIKTKNAIQIAGTSMYYVVPEGMSHDYLPVAYKEPTYVSAKQVGTPVGKAAVGLAAVAIVGSVIGNAVSGGKKDDE